jgi:hypothetical protein
MQEKTCIVKKYSYYANEGISLEKYKFMPNEEQNLRLKAKTYLGRFIEPGLAKYDDETILIKVESLPLIADRHRGVPMIIEHQNLDNNNVDKLTVGYVSEVFINRNGFVDNNGIKHEPDGWAWAKFIIYDNDAADLIDKMNWKLSNSYEVIKSNAENGTYHNVPYNSEVLDVKGLHIAIVEIPRYEDVKIIQNSLDNKNKIILNENCEGSISTKNIDNSQEIDYYYSFSMKGAISKLLGKSEKVAPTTEQVTSVKSNSMPVPKNAYFNSEELGKVAVKDVINAVSSYLASKKENENKEKENEGEAIDLDKKFKINDDVMNGHELLEHYKNCMTSNEAETEDEVKENADEDSDEIKGEPKENADENLAETTEEDLEDKNIYELIEDEEIEEAEDKTKDLAESVSKLKEIQKKELSNVKNNSVKKITNAESNFIKSYKPSNNIKEYISAFDFGKLI